MLIADPINEILYNHAYNNPLKPNFREGAAGLLFIKPSDSVFDQIVKGLETYDEFSKEAINFYIPGFEIIYNYCTSKEKYFNEKWIFNSTKFLNTILLLEQNINWTYSGEAELLIFYIGRKKIPNKSNNSKEYYTDFDPCIKLPLERLARENKGYNLDRDFYKIFKEARYSNDETFINRLSDKLSASKFADISRNAILNCICKFFVTDKYDLNNFLTSITKKY